MSQLRLVVEVTGLSDYQSRLLIPARYREAVAAHLRESGSGLVILPGNQRWLQLFIADEWLRRPETRQAVLELSRVGPLIFIGYGEDEGWGYTIFHQGQEVSQAEVVYRGAGRLWPQGEHRPEAFRLLDVGDRTIAAINRLFRRGFLRWPLTSTRAWHRFEALLEIPQQANVLDGAVEQVMVPRLGAAGFLGRKLDRDAWEFVRARDGVTHTVMLIKSRHWENALKLQLASSRNPHGEGSHAVTRRRPDDPGGDYWHFHDYQSLLQVLAEMAAHIEQKCIPWLESPEGTPPPTPQVPEALRRALLEDPEGFAAAMAARVGAPPENEQALAALEAFLRSRWEEDPAGDPTLLAEAAGYYGELVRNTLGGQWQWEGGGPVLRGLQGKLEVVRPLDYVLHYWPRGCRQGALQQIFAWQRREWWQQGEDRP